MPEFIEQNRAENHEADHDLPRVTEIMRSMFSIEAIKGEPVSRP